LTNFYLPNPLFRQQLSRTKKPWKCPLYIVAYIIILSYIFISNYGAIFVTTIQPKQPQHPVFSATLFTTGVGGITGFWVLP
jgi:choline-glycine betaine transporter